MYLKKLMLTIIFGISLLGSARVSANQSTNHMSLSPIKQVNKSHGVKKLLTAEQYKELTRIRNNLQEQLVPLLKEKIALKMQLKGKMATSQTQWTDISGLVEQLNEINSKISNLVARTQLSTFQKLGIFLPLPHHFHHHCQS